MRVPTPRRMPRGAFNQEALPRRARTVLLLHASVAAAHAAFAAAAAVQQHPGALFDGDARVGVARHAWQNAGGTLHPASTRVSGRMKPSLGPRHFVR